MLEWLMAYGATAAAVDWTRVAVAILASASTGLVLWAARGLARRQHARLAATEATERLEIPLQAASRTTLPFILVLCVFAGLATYGVEGRSAALLQKLVTIALFWQAGLWVSTVLVAWLDHRRRVTLGEDRAVAGSIGIIRVVARAAIWAMVLLLTLDNLGVDITALVAGLGIGGIAVALALQNVLGDLLASLSIALDQPFVLGDFLVVGEHMGSVEYIGIKSTRLRSLTGEQVVISNADLLASRLHNYGRMYERRVTFTLGVTYETPREKLRQIAPLLRRAVEAQRDVRFDRAHFAAYGPYSLDFEVVYYVLSPDFGRHMDAKQGINFRIHEAFESLGVEFAYPTQTVWLPGGTGAEAPTAGAAA